MSIATNLAQEQAGDTVLRNEQKMQWFKDAKLGIYNA